MGAALDWLAQHGPVVALLLFFVIFICIALWAYAPGNRRRLEALGAIPLRDNASAAAEPDGDGNDRQDGESTKRVG